MSDIAAISQHLPFLRRFARALAGSQASGDAYAIATLEAIVEDAGGDDAAEPQDPRLELYRVFLAIWNSVPLNNRDDDDSDANELAGAADRTLKAITPLPRVAFLLRAVEGFSTREIAVLLDRDGDEVAALLAQAGREIAAHIKTDVLIIEDEPIIAMDLEALVVDLGHQVTEIARTHKEAIAAIARRQPGLVLADVHLADGSSGLEAVSEILSTHSVPVIFITAYPERLLTGERPEPTFLITKPFQPDTVRAVISQALFFQRTASLVDQGQD
jgi:CheY-like chemotaxis protein/DNA-directed RNA polymerase specialized sigma24 family protein